MTSDDDQTIPPAMPPVHPALAKALEAQGYSTLTPVQLAVLDLPEPDADLLVSAQTGSGKTVAFGLAIAPTLLGDEQRFGAPAQPLGLMIAPTRELAMQVQREINWLYAEAGVVTASCVGGMDQRTERRALERGAHIVVGTPGRLRDHIMRNALDLSAIRAVVLDEADEMLDLGFREDLEFILAAAPPERRTLLFSATVPRAIAELAREFQRDAQRITATASSEAHADIEYRVTLVQNDEREHAIINTLLLNDNSSALVFCHTREAVRHLTARLANRGFDVVALSGELAQSERTSALQAMRDGRAKVCVATDVAARGIDLPNLDLVIHADIPSNPATLLHRSGRTGRAGRKGVCVLIAPLHRRTAVSRVLGYAHLEATYQSAPTIAEIEARYREQILEAAAATTEPDEAEAPVVAELLEKLTPAQLAVAYLRQQLAARPVPEEVSHVRVDAAAERSPRKGKRFEDGPEERVERAPSMVGGVWFTLSLGRKHRADPKWLLPMICKAGGLTKRDVGSIKILDLETRFEISADKAQEFAARTAGARLEKNVRIDPAEAPTSGPRSYARHDEEPRGERPKYDKPRSERPAYDKPKYDKPAYDKPRYDKPAYDKPAYDKPKYDKAKPDAARPDKPRRYDPAAGERVMPAAGDLPERNNADAPRKPKRSAAPPEAKAKFKPKFQGNPKDKGKPKHKGKPGKEVGELVRVRPAKG